MGRNGLGGTKGSPAFFTAMEAGTDSARAGGASRLYLSCAARPTLLLVVATLSFANVVQGARCLHLYCRSRSSLNLQDDLSHWERSTGSSGFRLFRSSRWELGSLRLDESVERESGWDSSSGLLWSALSVSFLLSSDISTQR